MKKLTGKIRPTQKNLDKIPKQSGIYVLHRGSKSRYVGSAGAGRLRERIGEQLSRKRGITSIQYRTATSEAEARALEKKYRDRLNPEQKRV